MKFQTGIVLSLLLSVKQSSVAADRVTEECEACGLLVWRMQTIVAQIAKALESTKRAKEKRAEKSTKAHSKRWLKQEYGVELSGAIEAQIDALQSDSRIISGACRYGQDAMVNSALRGDRFDRRCESRTRSRVSSLLEEFQDELVSAVISGHGAGAACVMLVPHCTAERAKMLLGPKYHDEMNWLELDMVQPGYADQWTLQKNPLDESVYWFNRAKMESRKEPPDGWTQDADGEWKRPSPGGGGAARPDAPGGDAEASGDDGGEAKDEV